jgi:hypothetical protein
VPERESAFRGAGGPDASGPLVATQRIHAWITDHPGVTKDELIKLALDRQWVDPGYANRWYAAKLNRARKQQRTVGTPGRRPRLFDETPASVNELRAQTAKISEILNHSRLNGSIALEDGGYRALRPIRATHGMTKEQMVTDPDEVRADILEREVLRGLRLYGFERVESPQGRVPKELRLLLVRWARAKLITRPS